jgi:hypothetical protein
VVKRPTINGDSEDIEEEYQDNQDRDPGSDIDVFGTVPVLDQRRGSRYLST